MLAIVIPYYKRTFFEETLQSLAAQTDKRFHVYIGDDAAPEPCEDLLEKYKGTFAYTFKRFESNLGGISLVKQWERCIDMVQEEEWLMILGDDDVLGTNVVEEFYSNITNVILKKINVIRFSTLLIDDNSNVISKIFTNSGLESAFDFIFLKIKGEKRSSLSENIFKSNKFNYIKFENFPSGLYSDDLIIYDFAQDNGIFSINTAQIKIRKGNFNLSGVNGKKEDKILARKMFYRLLFGEKLNLLSDNKKIIIDLLIKQSVGRLDFYVIKLILKYQFKENSLCSIVEFFKIIYYFQIKVFRWITKQF